MKSNAPAKLLTVVVVLQAITLLGKWLGVPSVVSPAVAQIPDAGGQRNQIIEEMRGLNAKVGKLIDLLESGKVEVRIAEKAR